MLSIACHVLAGVTFIVVDDFMGSSTDEAEIPPVEEEQTMVSITPVSLGKAAEDTMQRQEVPAGYRDYLRRYFDGMQPDEREK